LAYEDTWFRGARISDALLEQTQALRERYYSRFGIDIPPIRFGLDESLGPTALSVEVLNQTSEDPDAKPFVPEDGREMARLMRELEYRVALGRVRFVSAEKVQAVLNAAHPALKEWLGKVYSLTDLKVLLRGVLSPSDAEIDELINWWDSGSPVEYATPPQGTIRYPSWLLSSLVFWDVAGEGGNPDALQARFRDLQRRRMNKPLLPSGVPEGITEGVAALLEGQVDRAHDQFLSAIKKNRRAAINGFLSLADESCVDLDQRLRETDGR
jgi:hypothetical protein